MTQKLKASNSANTDKLFFKHRGIYNQMAAQKVVFSVITMFFTFQRIPPGFGRPPSSNEEGGVSTSKDTFFTEYYILKVSAFLIPI